MPQESNSEEIETEKARLFTDIAIKNKLVSLEQLAESREVQLKIEELGVRPKPLPEILLEKGFLSQQQYEKIAAHADKLAKVHRIKGYELITKLGQGSMGTVFQARQLSLDRIVAIKILAPFLQRNEKFVGRFIKEAKILARLNHPNIVQCIDVGVSNELYYMAMEFCDGPTVLQVIRRGGAIAQERSLRIILQVTRALEHAYISNIIHRDIKPDNIMIVAGGTAKLCDLGLVKDLDTSGDTTDTGSTLGTPNYISPEQARGDAMVDVRADIYSLGASFYHMVTGFTPFTNQNPAATMVAHINEELQPPIERNDALMPKINEIIIKMMHKHPDDRYQTPAELRSDLEAALQEVGNDGKPKGPVLRPRSRRRRR